MEEASTGQCILKAVKKQKVAQIKPKDKEHLKSVGFTIKKVLNNDYRNAIIMYFDEDGEAMWWHMNDGDYYKTIGLIADNLIKYSFQEIMSNILQD